MLPFKDTLVLFELTGAEVKQLLEDLAVRYPYGAGTSLAAPRYCSVAGTSSGFYLFLFTVCQPD